MVNTAEPLSCPSSPPKPANRSNWPLSAAFFVVSTESTMSSCTSMSPLRGCPSESNAPDLISDSVIRLLQANRSILSK